MNRIKTFVLAVAVASLALQPFTAFATSTISSVTRIDVGDGSIKGDGAEYTFVMPKSWQNGSVTVNRERPAFNSQFLDKLTFLYIPIDRLSRSTAFATLYVCENKPDINIPGTRKLLETDKYIFLFESPSRNNFSDLVDKANFDQYLSSATNDTLMASQIEVPQSQRRLPSNTITVNGRMLRSTAIRHASGTVYIPMRETCNALGYSVAWNAAISEVSIYSAEMRHAVAISLLPHQQNYSTMILNDRAYISSVFFIRVLNTNIEVDGNNNVIIRSRL